MASHTDNGKLARCIYQANNLLDERILPGFLQDQLYLWTLEASGVLKAKTVSGGALLIKMKEEVT